MLVFLVLMASCSGYQPTESTSNNLQEFDRLMADIEAEFIYYKEKKKLLRCIEKAYRPFVDTISQPYYKVLFYDRLLDELYDSHIHLNTNTGQSYRLNSPVYAELKENRFFLKNVFASELQYKLPVNVIGAQILEFNGQHFEKVVEGFHTQCQDKSNPVIREWVANKVLAGRRDQPRKLLLRLRSGQESLLDLDQLKLKERPGLLEATRKGKVGVIRFNNSLGNDSLPYYFDLALQELWDTKALVLDLRNTSDGGNTGVAEPIMGRFIAEEKGYQIVEGKEETYTRKVFPVGKTYTKPLYVLVGRWTGSMGEGMAIGFDGMKRATVVGTEMYRLAGGMKSVKLLHSNFSARISIEKLRHLDGRLRETYVPPIYFNQTETTNDEALTQVLHLISDER